jgi:hypothetical protein
MHITTHDLGDNYAYDISYEYSEYIHTIRHGSRVLASFTDSWHYPAYDRVREELGVVIALRELNGKDPYAHQQALARVKAHAEAT